MVCRNTNYDGFVTSVAGAAATDYPNGDVCLIRCKPVVGGYAARAYFEFNIASFPAAGIVDSTLELDIGCPIVNPGPLACQIYYLNVRPSQAGVGALAIWNAFGGAGSVLLGNYTFTACGASVVIPLGDTADADIMAKVAQGWYTIGIRFNADLTDGTDRSVRPFSKDRVPPANPVAKLCVIT